MFSRDFRRIMYLCMASIFLLMVIPFLGVNLISPGQIFRQPEMRELVLNYRVPRMLIGYAAGAILALSGLSFQSVFSNPLATPFTLGIAGAASLGAVLAMYAGWQNMFLAAMAMALFSTVLMYAFSRRQHWGETHKILLTGVALNMLFSSGILFLQFQLDYLDTFKVLHWLVGSIQNISWDSALWLSTVLVIGFVFFALNVRTLDLLSLGEEFALSKGVHVSKVRWQFIALNSLLVGTVVSLLGPIGFVGLMIPNLMRFWLGASHQVLLWGCALGGGLILMLADLIARNVCFPIEVPVGVFTSFIGAIFFLYLVSKPPDRV